MNKMPLSRKPVSGDESDVAQLVPIRRRYVGVWHWAWRPPAATDDAGLPARVADRHDLRRCRSPGLR
jgi:hypothetical protein